jgi:hypothetical protein
VTGLTNGTTYTFTVVATNGLGDSEASPASGAVVPSGSTTTALSVTPASPAYGQATTLTATVSGSATVNGGTVTFTEGATTLGTATVANSAATYSSAGLSTGGHTVTATYSGTSGWGASSASTSFTVNKAAQEITFGPLPSRSYGQAPFGLDASASSGLPVTYAATGGCTVADGSVTITAAGDCTVVASQGGNANFLAAPDVSQTFTVAKASQTITFEELADRTFGDAPFTVDASASSSLPVTFSVSGDCTATGASLSITGAGQCAVTASQAGDGNYEPAASVERTFTIAKSSQTITFGAIADRTFGDDPFTVVASASSGLPVVFTATGECTVAANVVTLTGGGTCTVTASQAGNDDYEAAPDVVRIVGIAKASQAIMFASLPNRTYGDAPFTVAATASSGLPTTFSASGACTVARASVTLVGAGTCTVTASQAGNDDYDPATAIRRFTVAKASQHITFAPVGDHPYGSAPVELGASSSSGLAVTFSAAGVCEVQGRRLAFTGAGACSVVASQPGNADVRPAADVAQAITVQRAAQAIAFGAIAARTFGDDPFLVTARASSGLPVTFATAGECRGDGARVTIEHAGSCTVTASQAGDRLFLPAGDVTQVFTIAKRPQSIEFGPLAARRVDEAPFALGATATSGLAVGYGADGACRVADNVVTATQAGTCTITARQAGDRDHLAAATVTRSFTVEPALSDGDKHLELELGFAVGTNVDDAHVVVTGEGLQPGSTVVITMHSKPRVIGRALVGADGTFRARVAVPPDAERGDHRIIVDGTGADGEPMRTEQAFTIGSTGTITRVGSPPAPRAAPSVPPTSRRDGGPSLAVLSLIAAVAGAVVFVVARRRRRQPEAAR